MAAKHIDSRDFIFHNLTRPFCKVINRTNLSASDIREALKKDVVTKQLELLRMRNTHKAFEKGAVITVSEEGPKLSIRYDNGEAYALLTVDFEAGAYEIELS